MRGPSITLMRDFKVKVKHYLSITPRSAKLQHNSLWQQNGVKFGTYFTQARIFFSKALFARLYVFPSLIDDSWLVGFSLVVEFHQGGSATNKASLSERHWISQRVLIIATIQKKPKKIMCQVMDIWPPVFLQFWPRKVATISNKYVVVISNKYMAVISDKHPAIISKG